MDRRETVLALLAVSTIGSALCAVAQPSKKVWRIGTLSPGYVSDGVPYVKEIDRGLAEAGLKEGRDFIFENRYAEGKNERLSGFASELVRLNTDAILANTTNSRHCCSCSHSYYSNRLYRDCR